MNLTPFVPKRTLRNGHLMTLYAWGKPRHFPQLPAPEDRFFEVAPETRVLAHCHWQADRAAHPALIALHGLEGSSSAHYMRGLADKAHAAGFNVILLNQRNCGGTEQHAPGLYHSGLTADADRVIREVADRDGIDRVVVVGYSLGGNLSLKLAGDYGDSPLPQIRGVCAVSPVIELAECVRALERRQNIVYQLNFVRGLRGRMRRKAAWFPGRFEVERLARIYTVREFDEVYTAPHFGFRDASDYYHRASAMRVIDRVRVPTMIISAEDDPFVPAEPFRHPSVTNNPHIDVILTRHGGHCGFVAEPSGKDDGYWAETEVVRFAQRVVTTEASRPAGARTPVLSPALRA